MKKLNIDECHDILLSIALEFDKICRAHNIRYYMLGGTMLGAVRHKGFIPWDDDMDFGVPRSDYKRLMKLLPSVLSPHLRMLTRENGGFVFSNFMKIDNSRTHVNDSLYDEDMKMGINIDIFPLDKGLKTAFRTFIFNKYIVLLLMLKDYKCIHPSKRSFVKSIIARILRFLFYPIGKERLLAYIDRCIFAHVAEASELFVNYYGRWHNKEIVKKEIFGTPKEYEYNGHLFYGVEDANAYLTRLYGDYLKLPPEEERNAHLTGMYIK
jgi:lipopolysaccharide cholinephosphotransferase